MAHIKTKEQQPEKKIVYESLNGMNGIVHHSHNNNF